MAQQVQRTETSTMIKATKVADYIVERIAAEGISHCFGVAGDYVFPICDAVDSSPKVKWIGCANELNASYAAECGGFQLPTIFAPIMAPNPTSVRRDRPRHMTVFPGGGSLARAR